MFALSPCCARDGFGGEHGALRGTPAAPGTRGCSTEFDVGVPTWPCCRVAVLPCCRVAVLPCCRVAVLPCCRVAVLPCWRVAASSASRSDGPNLGAMHRLDVS